MRLKKICCIGLLLFVCFASFSQENEIVISASLDAEKDQLNIQQKITFYNTSTKPLSEIFLHNWANSFKDNTTPLSKRFIEDYNKSFYFAKATDRGYSKIYNLSVNAENVTYKNLKEQSDIVKVNLKTPLLPKDSIDILVTYAIKIPSAKFTGYGKIADGYHLRFWYVTPAVYKNGWKLMSNLNIDDLYEEATNFEITIELPNHYFLESNLYQYKTTKEKTANYFLVGKSTKDVILNIGNKKTFTSVQTKNIRIYTDLLTLEITTQLSKEILNRELLFIEDFLGKYPYKEIFIDKITQQKNPIYGLHQLPNFLHPFSDVFKWDLTLFKAISKKYIENTLLLNKRTDYWLVDGLQTYLMMEYVEKYYPEVKLLGKVSELWGVRSFNVAKLNYNDKYPFVYQFSTRKFLDQSLATSADSLSNFNRKIVNKYKAGLGLRYLNDFLGNSILKQSVQEFYQKSKSKTTSSSLFKEILSKNTDKDLQWFFEDYIQTNKKIDYTIKTAKTTKDSINVTIQNKRNSAAPFVLYGLKDKEITFKKWITAIDSVKTITIPKGDFTRLVLNYEQRYPEYNFLNNSKRLEKNILNKPIKFTLFKDIESPNYHQIFYEPDVKYNFYDGLILGMKLHNKPIIKKNLEMKLAPSYATKSESVIGSFSILYNQFFENSSLYRIKYGVAGGTLHYAPQLSYTSIIPYVAFNFNRKTLRDVGGKSLGAKLVYIDKEVPFGVAKSPQDRYSVLSISYAFNKPDIIKGFGYRINSEIAKDFSKISTDIRFRHLTAKNRSLDFRFYAGMFLNNSTEGDYFSFGLDRANDYLFELNYYGRSEDSGIFSQQFVVAEGGFKSVLPTRFANQYMVAFNSSIGMWALGRILQ